MSLIKFKDLYPSKNNYDIHFNSYFAELGGDFTEFYTYYYNLVQSDYDNAYFRYDDEETIIKHIGINLKNNLSYLYLLYKLWVYYYKGDITEDEIINILSKDYSSTQSSELAQDYTNHRKNIMANTPTTYVNNFDDVSDVITKYINEGSEDGGEGTFNQDTTKDYSRSGNVESVFTNLRFIPKTISDAILKSVSELFIPFYNLEEEYDN